MKSDCFIGGQRAHVCPNAQDSTPNMTHYVYLNGGFEPAETKRQTAIVEVSETQSGVCAALFVSFSRCNTTQTPSASVPKAGRPDTRGPLFWTLVFVRSDSAHTPPVDRGILYRSNVKTPYIIDRWRKHELRSDGT